MMNTEKEVRVWDVFVRFFHWALVLSFMLAYLSSEDEWLAVHTFAGYSILLLIGLRLIWGLVGTRHARFRDFVKHPVEIKQYLKEVFLLRPKRYLGHNPAGGAMIVLMLIALLVTTLSGLATYAVEEGAGPLAGWIAHESASREVVEDVHEFFANFTLLLVVFHVAGVLLESLLHRENLVRAMFTGKKSLHVD
ncbi:cytochrome b/b6 domain-containing protein [Thiohalophilus sp.]|uniref:cytochrome b/b6 domain-containing protein n=1 Tax=Thiohalophilus sp. TaxID=3028392 RepID=UPI003974DCEE